MNIAIIGYGKMGREIAKAAEAKGISARTIDPNAKDADFKEINQESMEGIDVCLDFSHPDAVAGNIEKAAGFRKSMVIGTTGWYNSIDKAKKIVKDAGIGLVWSGNFSLGVNAYFGIIGGAAKIMNKLADYDVFVHEFHHSQKADSPSGTAIMLGKIITTNIKRKSKIVTGELKRKIGPNELHISSTRSGSIPGTHIVGFDSKADTIEIRHTARSREGFALGALMAAEWVKGRKGFYGIEDMLGNEGGK